MTFLPRLLIALVFITSGCFLLVTVIVLVFFIVTLIDDVVDDVDVIDVTVKMPASSLYLY